MKTFLARLHFSVSISGKTSYEEQLRLILGDSPSDAYQKANKIGHSEAVCLPQLNYGSVTWTFTGITELNEIAELVHGTELDSKTVEPTDKMEFGNYIDQRVNDLQREIPMTGRKSLSSLYSACFLSAF